MRNGKPYRLKLEVASGQSPCTNCARVHGAHSVHIPLKQFDQPALAPEIRTRALAFFMAQTPPSYCSPERYGPAAGRAPF